MREYYKQKGIDVNELAQRSGLFGVQPAMKTVSQQVGSSLNYQTSIYDSVDFIPTDAPRGQKRPSETNNIQTPSQRRDTIPTSGLRRPAESEVQSPLTTRRDTIPTSGLKRVGGGLVETPAQRRLDLVPTSGNKRDYERMGQGLVGIISETFPEWLEPQPQAQRRGNTIPTSGLKRPFETAAQAAERAERARKTS